MSSGITFSGFNNIDFSVVVNAVMAQASQPLKTLQTRQTALKQQSSTFETLTSKLSALDAAVNALGKGSALTSHAASVSDSSIISAATGSGSSSGHYDIVVNELARAQVTASASTSPDASTTSVATGGWLTINGKQIDVQAPVTLSELAEAINETDGIAVQASVVQTGTNAYRLVLTGVATGESNGFTVENSLTGGSGISFTDTDNDGVSGDSSADNAVQATNAQLTVNNLAITSQSNTVDQAIPGTTLTLLKKSPTTTVGLDVKSDANDLQTKLQNFVTAYNGLQQFATDQATSAANGNTSSIGRDPLFRGLKNELRSTLLNAYGTDAIQTLSQLGVEFTRTGTLQINSSQFAAATASGVKSVTGLLGDSGVFDSVHTLLTRYTQASGTIPQAQTRLKDQVSSLDREIANMQIRLDQQRATLQKEYTAADLAMSQLKSQSGSLAAFATNTSSTSGQ
ncbi:MAG: flagellar filament capping protein FliD [Vicinamibacterales bacterium]